ncbi:hypothetical protein COO60DRAFT_1557832 [Scenedesmus sp. NREL 46B-D3]|nr:hypothetical protein COO60DRAFT_1557832 [Scenedesmus sp. NREL 46B-D3]
MQLPRTRGVGRTCSVDNNSGANGSFGACIATQCCGKTWSGGWCYCLRLLLPQLLLLLVCRRQRWWHSSIAICSSSQDSRDCTRPSPWPPRRSPCARHDHQWPSRAAVLQQVQLAWRPCQQLQRCLFSPSTSQPGLTGDPSSSCAGAKHGVAAAA